MNPIHHLWTQLTHHKLDRTLPDRVFRRIILVNQLSLICCFFCILHAAVNITIGNYILLLVLGIGIVGFFSSYLLNIKQYHGVAKLNLVIFANLILFTVKILLGEAMPTDMIYVPLVCTIFLLFDWREKWKMTSSLLLTATTLLIYHLFEKNLFDAYIIPLPTWALQFNTASTFLIVCWLLWFCVNFIISFYKQTEEELELQGLAMEYAGDYVFWFDAKGNIEYANQIAINKFGYLKRELLINHIRLIDKEFDQAAWDQMWQEVKRKGVDYFERTFTTAQGVAINANVSANYVEYLNKELICAFIKDTTEQKRSENFEHAKQQLLESLTQGMDWISCVNTFLCEIELLATHRFYTSIYLTDKSEKNLVFYTAPNLPSTLAQDVPKVAIEDDNGTCGSAAYNRKRIVTENIAESSTWEGYKYVALKYNLKSCWSFPIISSQGKVLGTFAIYYKQIHTPGAVDLEIAAKMSEVITLVLERRLIDEALKKSEAETKALLNAIPDLIFKLDEEGNYLECQADNQEDLHIDPKQLIGANVKDFFEGSFGKYLMEVIEEAIETEEIKTIEYQRPNLKGVKQMYEARVVPNKNREVIVFVRNITERISFEEELKIAKEKAEEAAKAKTLFLSNMSHEIRTPMNVIMGLTNILLQDNLTQSQREHLQTIHLSSENLLSIINDILDLSKVEAGKISFEEKIFSLPQFLEEIKQTFAITAQEKKLDFQVEMGEKVPKQIKGDKIRLNQILLNLVSNAFKFTNEGAIHIRVKEKKQTEKTVSLIFEVADTGIGIPASQQSTIFDTFTQALSDSKTKSQGTGLGLAITKQLIELQKGKISVESDLGSGSTFSVLLTFKKVTEDIFDTPQNIILPMADGLKDVQLLLVEDNKLNQYVARQILEDWKVKVEVANSGLEAIEKIVKKDYDVILMDLQMPDMDGYETTKYIRNNLTAPEANIPIIALTADAFPETQAKALAAGMNDFVTKPFNQEELFSAIYKYSRQRLIQPAFTDEMLIESIEDDHIDVDYLKRVLNNDIDALKYVFKLFTEDLSNDVSNLQKALDKHNLAGLAKVAHKLKSAFNTLGAKHTSDKLLRIEKSSRKGVYDDELLVLVREVEESYQQTCEEIED
ncbi:MAG: response regulator [Thermonemataceae bacterium]